MNCRGRIVLAMDLRARRCEVAVVAGRSIRPLGCT
jgi:hypothetical protein